jgi:uncharacterized protein (TIGR03086 family)
MDVIELHKRAVGEFQRRVAAVQPDQWGLRTPCAEWDVRALVNHVVGEEKWTPPMMQGRTIADVGDALDGDLLGDEPASVVDQAAPAAQDALAEGVTAGRVVHLSFGDTPAAEYAYQLAADHLVHAWDLAAATGSDRTFDAELVDGVAAWFAEWEEVYRSGGAIGPRTEAGSADPQARLIAAFGRDPGWTPAHGVVAAFGAAFATVDVDAIMALMTDDCVFESTSPPPDGTRYEGAAAVRAVWDGLRSQTTDPRFETEHMTVYDDRAVVRWVFSWAEPEESMEQQAGRGHIRGVDLIRLRDGLVAEKLSYVKG